MYKNTNMNVYVYLFVCNSVCIYECVCVNVCACDCVCLEKMYVMTYV